MIKTVFIELYSIETLRSNLQWCISINKLWDSYFESNLFWLDFDPKHESHNTFMLLLIKNTYQHLILETLNNFNIRRLDALCI